MSKRRWLQAHWKRTPRVGHFGYAALQSAGELFLSFPSAAESHPERPSPHSRDWCRLWTQLKFARDWSSGAVGGGAVRGGASIARLRQAQPPGRRSARHSYKRSSKQRSRGASQNRPARRPHQWHRQPATETRAICSATIGNDQQHRACAYALDPLPTAPHTFCSCSCLVHDINYCEITILNILEVSAAGFSYVHAQRAARAYLRDDWMNELNTVQLA